MRRDFLRWLLPISIAVAGVALWQWQQPNRQSLACAFIPQAGSDPIKTTSGSSLAERIWLEGSLDADTQDDMRSFEGVIAVGPDSQGLARASGNVWLDRSGAVEGMAIYATHPAFGSEDLSVATLSEDGMLDRDRLTAYLFIDPPDKLQHPAAYLCAVGKRKR